MFITAFDYKNGEIVLNLLRRTLTKHYFQEINNNKTFRFKLTCANFTVKKSEVILIQVYFIYQV